MQICNATACARCTGVAAQGIGDAKEGGKDHWQQRHGDRLQIENDEMFETLIHGFVRFDVMTRRIVSEAD